MCVYVCVCVCVCDCVSVCSYRIVCASLSQPVRLPLAQSPPVCSCPCPYSCNARACTCVHACMPARRMRALTHTPARQATIVANDCRTSCCDDANCQQWLFSPADGCWLSDNPALTCIPNWADFGHWVGQRRKVPKADAKAGMGGGLGEKGEGEVEVGRLEGILGLSSLHVSEVLAQIDRGVFAEVQHELYSPLVWRGNSQSWLQEVPFSNSHRCAVGPTPNP